MDLLQVEARLRKLKTDFEAGQAQLSELERQHWQLRETLLRISGAIQVLEELLAQPGKESQVEEGPVVIRRTSGSAD